MLPWFLLLNFWAEILIQSLRQEKIKTIVTKAKKIVSCSYKRTWCCNIAWKRCMPHFIIAVYVYKYIFSDYTILAMKYAWRHRPHKNLHRVILHRNMIQLRSRFLVRLQNLAFGLRRVKHKYLFFLSFSNVVLSLRLIHIE